MSARGTPSDDPTRSLERYYRAIAPWMDQALEDRGDLGWWRKTVTGLAPRRIVELGCGTGRVTRVLAGGGRIVMALDRVDAMVRAARDRLQDVDGVRVVRADLRHPPLRAGWDLVAAPNDPLIHLVPEGDRQRAVDAGGRLLSPEGDLVLDLMWWTPDEQRQALSPAGLRRTREVTLRAGETLLVEERWRMAGDRRTVAALYRYLPSRGEGVTAAFRGRRWTLPELRQRLGRAGLHIVDVSGDYDGRPFEPRDARTLLVVARREPR